MYYKYVVIP